MSDYKCLESLNSIFVDKRSSGYLISPCCLFKQTEYNAVKDIRELIDNPIIKNIQQGFKDNWKRPECQSCISKETVGLQSKRQKSLLRGSPGKLLRWDLRPGFTCNLKCAMCNPYNSSKWGEDLEIFEKYNGKVYLEQNDREGLDWDWIYDNCIDIAEEIYIAGGEPFYMKAVQTFLTKLSEHPWNCNNTMIVVQTNAVSNTPKLLKILKRFKKLNFGISVDGWGTVNDLIRYPTKHDTFVKNVKELTSITKDFYFNITVQAMNLPNVDKTVNKVSNWGRWEIHKLSTPSHLSINSLKPSVVERVKNTTSIDLLKEFLKDYKFDNEKNIKMQNYLLELDNARGTDSKTTLPWCFE